ncbi:MAG: S41 family peptidase [Planctomycetes bacterium]|nr:S41 family peptidase [Planctomycetota bacterium]
MHQPFMVPGRRLLAASGRTLGALTLWLAALAGTGLVGGNALRAQVAFVTPTPPAPVMEGAVTGILDRGQKMEQQRRWGEALSLYEDALRHHHGHAELEQRFAVTRTHYDLSRRYNDASFRETLSKLTFQQALDLYGEVLLKVHTHYVHNPNWNQLFDRGTMALELALTDPVFVERNLPRATEAQIDRFRGELHTKLNLRKSSLPIETRHAAREMVATSARLAHEQLGLLESAVVLEYVCGATNALDAYSTFLTAGQLNEVYSQIEGNFVGLGIELKTQDGNLLILKVISGSPAERGGLRAGDLITGVEGRTVRELSADQAANMLQGKEGTIVQLSVVTPGTAPRQLRIRREQVEVPSVDNARILDSTLGIAYLRLTCFQKTTARDLDAALWKLHRDGMRSLIIDLRGNPGGLLTTSVEVVDRFVERGTIVSTRGRSAQEDFVYSAHEQGTWHVPLVVLIDGESASASEIFAGAIRDHHRGTIVGARSYGKGSVQGIFPLNLASSGLRLTTAKFYSPQGQAYSQVGVQPDVLVQQTARPVADDNGNVRQPVAEGDPALDAATNVAKREMARR